jgi:hypothetical protein
MSRMWIPVSPVHARAHPLYGRGGWLTLFMLTVLIGLVASGGFWAIILAARTAADSLIQFLGVYAAVSAFAGLVILALFILKNPNFRIAAISLMLVPWPALAAIYYNTLPESFILGGSVMWLVSVAIWATYLQRSRRVRVTFEHCIAAEAAQARSEPRYYTHASNEEAGAAGARLPAGALAQRFDALNSQRLEDATADADPNERCWAQALAEYESDRRKPGLWARAYAEGQGDEAAAKAHYLKLRAEQLLGEHEEQAREFIHRQNAEQEEERLNDWYERSLTGHQRKIRHAVTQAEYGGEGAFNAGVALVHLLGGTVERKPSVIFSSSGWRVELAGHQQKFADDGELMNWITGYVLPKARLLLPPKQHIRAVHPAAAHATEVHPRHKI